jgi:ketosteroid isomerase-like protein
MSEATNVAILKEAYRRWHETRGGSVDHWMSMMDDDVKFGSLAQGAPAMAFAKSYDSRKVLQNYFNGLLADWEMIYYRTDEYIAQGEAVFMRGACSWRHKRTGRIVDTPKVDFWRFRDGKAIEFYEYYDTAQVIAAAGG